MSDDYVYGLDPLPGGEVPRPAENPDHPIRKESKMASGEALGARLLAERERRGIGLRQAAEETGVSFNTLSRIERGHDCRYSHALAVLAWLPAPLNEGSETTP